MPNDQRKMIWVKKVATLLVRWCCTVHGLTVCDSARAGLRSGHCPKMREPVGATAPLSFSCSLSPGEKKDPSCKGFPAFTGCTRHGMGASVSWWFVFRTAGFSEFCNLVFWVQCSSEEKICSWGIAGSLWRRGAIRLPQCLSSVSQRGRLSVFSVRCMGKNRPAVTGDGPSSPCWSPWFKAWTVTP